MMIVKESTTTKIILDRSEVVGMIEKFLEEHGFETSNFLNDVEIRARRGTASVKVDTLEIKYKETEDHGSHYEGEP